MKKLFLLLFFACFLSYSFSFSFHWDLPWVNIITRQQWGADSKYLFSDYEAYKQIILNQKKFLDKIKKDKQAYEKWQKEQQKRQMQSDYLLKNWKNEIKADKFVSKLNWKKLWWSIAYKKNKTKIIIHHTAADYKRFKTVEDVKKYIRWVYYYHATKRWWWDIGYNFIIWPFGNIYEWRIGWDNVVWANSEFNNVPSIGIALVWNFNIQKPTKAQIKSLIKLSTALAKKYKIDPLKQVFYHKKWFKPPYILDVKSFALAWHKDTGYTQCPWTYLYELLPYIRQKVKENLSKQKTKKVVSKKKVKLNLKPKFSLNDEILIKIKWVNFVSCKSSTSHIKVNCKWNSVVVKNTLPSPKVFQKISLTADTNNHTYYIKFKWIFMPNLRLLIKQQVEKKYKINNNKIKKINEKIYLKSLKNVDELPIKVLLYELTTKVTTHKFKCSKTCTLYTDKWTYTAKTFTVDKTDNLRVWIWKKLVSTNNLTIDSNGGFIKFTNYNRKSYSWILWNFFRWKIIIKKDLFKPLNDSVKKTYVVINELPLKDYLKWIAEWNDQMSLEKLKVMALLAKTYTLFYHNWKNIHPSIPKWASYNAIDDPRIFQKYVGAWFEETSKLWPKALNLTKNKVLTYNWYIPILPYFSCSKWFTFSAKQKFWWIDTPYLQNSPDLENCGRFYWHWVWLSWKWAEKLAKLWFNYKQIINWYFPGVKVETY